MRYLWQRPEQGKMQLHAGRNRPALGGIAKIEK
jgi:hypothetical protein